MKLWKWLTIFTVTIKPKEELTPGEKKDRSKEITQFTYLRSST